MSKKKWKVVTINRVGVQPIDAAEHRPLDRKIKKNHEQLRNRYREVHGKKVDWISHWIEEGILFFTVRFTDGKSLTVTYSPCVLDAVDFSDMSTGHEVILKNYYQREDI
jgi:hypothetical protein